MLGVMRTTDVWVWNGVLGDSRWGGCIGTMIFGFVFFFLLIFVEMEGFFTGLLLYEDTY